MTRASARMDAVPWMPRGLNREEAAYYIGFGTTKFDQMVADRRMPRGKRVDGRIVWDRLALDLAFNELGEAAANSIDELLNQD